MKIDLTQYKNIMVAEDERYIYVSVVPDTIQPGDILFIRNKLITIDKKYINKDSFIGLTILGERHEKIIKAIPKAEIWRAQKAKF